MPTKLEKLFIEDGEYDWASLRGAFEKWVGRDWTIEAGYETEIVVKKGNDPACVAFKNFESWINGRVDADWWTFKNEYGLSEPKQCFLNYYETNEDFRSRVEGHTRIHEYGSRDQKENKTDGSKDETSHEYQAVADAGMIDENMVVKWGAVKGAMLKFSKEVDTIKGTKPSFDLESVKEAWNRWMMDKLGNEWVHFTSVKVDPERLDECISSLYEDEVEFRGLVESKYEYAPDEMEGNGGPDDDETDTVKFGGETYDTTDSARTSGDVGVPSDSGESVEGSREPSEDDGKVRFGGQTYEKAEEIDNDGTERQAENDTGTGDKLTDYESAGSGEDGVGNNEDPDSGGSGGGNRSSGYVRYSKWVGEAAEREQELNTGEIYNDNVWRALDRLPPSSVDCISTSPPYWALRDYDDQEYEPMCGDIDCDHAFHKGKCYHCDAWSGQLGHEPTKEMFLRDLVAILEKAKVVLKDTGHLFLNIGDTYVDKSAQMVPERIYAELIDQGWLLRDKIVWGKKVWLDDGQLVGNGQPSPHGDRLAHQWEPVYHFTKSKDYWVDIDSNRLEPPSFDGDMGKATQDSKFREGEDGRRGRQYNPMGTNPPDVWQINSDGYSGSHTAVFPEELPKRCIDLATPERVCDNCGKPHQKDVTVEDDNSVSAGGDDVSWSSSCSCGAGHSPGVVLDIFLGSGTTAKAAAENGYRWTGIEVSEKYAKEARERIPTGLQQKLI